MEAVPWFEKAYELKKDDVNTLDFLKSICFRPARRGGYDGQVQQVQYPCSRKPKAKSNSLRGAALPPCAYRNPGSAFRSRDFSCADVPVVMSVPSNS